MASVLLILSRNRRRRRNQFSPMLTNCFDRLEAPIIVCGSRRTRVSQSGAGPCVRLLSRPGAPSPRGQGRVAADKARRALYPRISLKLQESFRWGLCAPQYPFLVAVGPAGFSLVKGSGRSRSPLFFLSPCSLGWSIRFLQFSPTVLPFNMKVTRRGPGLKRPAKSSQNGTSAHSSSLRGAAGGRSDQDHYWLHLHHPGTETPTSARLLSGNRYIHASTSARAVWRPVWTSAKA
ncbi:hypothetical protein GE21DRAFT_8680 [Neurospora crassa]|uniref:Uncharacterized protein n=1 Tax=Neurospora crassa (strain ATCC 24698 / 74-OR23-1A / CBS 708.71 / DSM 1257 / FGSC 987) TaxID=367110 RepID=Q7S650_NEUCR|nr:hypothetical protein NCU04710 [Neurospora crassa OR74A]EAA31005.2 hypothetical protein NCU04710 [Neurospora crassa OR74A]KHE83284.1 hypothetical protein GE21DRAFT_8680 [Neurospora crassa]|eukprot:XP_960241.2 hypothetical protein NCU04710 [Neurospora crassa OR74A]